jgi:hypothetical protein
MRAHLRAQTTHEHVRGERGHRRLKQPEDSHQEDARSLSVVLKSVDRIQGTNGMSRLALNLAIALLPPSRKSNCTRPQVCRALARH